MRDIVLPCVPSRGTALLAGYGDRVQPRPQDTHGVLDLDDALGWPQDGTLVYCCHPEPLLEAVAARCRLGRGRAAH